MTGLPADQRDRYSRSLLMEWFTAADQRRLLNASVAVVGAGGLGSASSAYLVAAGIGTVGIVDAGTVSRSNLQRQVLYGADDIGRPKATRAANRLEALNETVTIEPIRERVTQSNAPDLLKPFDIVVDGLDTIRTRLTVNETTRALDIPFVHGAVYGFEGQLAVFRPGGPCYRCLVPSPPRVDEDGEEDPIGVFPPVPGIIGCMQAVEVIKLCLATGRVLDDRLRRYDAMAVQWIETPLESRSTCPVCAPDATETPRSDDPGGRS